MNDDITLGADAELDRINLAQALQDFETANERVLTLTHQLAELNQELVETRRQLDRLTSRYRLIIRCGDALGRTPLARPLAKLARWRSRDRR